MTAEENMQNEELEEKLPVEEQNSESLVQETSETIEASPEEAEAEVTQAPNEGAENTEEGVSEDNPQVSDPSPYEVAGEEDDEDEDENSELDDHTSHTQRDYSKLDMNALLNEAREGLNHPPKDAIRIIENVRPYFDDLLRKERKEALQHFVDQGGEPEAFVFDKDEWREQLNQLFHTAQEARAEERKRIEQEKEDNLKRKQAIIERLKEITLKDETDRSIDEVKALQKEWKDIRVVPRESSQELWDSYTFLLDKFYDNHSINIELKNLDRQKNLDQKIAIIQKLTELEAEENLKTAFILLNKYREDFRNIGPVPREVSDEVWDRFRSAYDQILKAKKDQYDELLKVRQMNAEKKRVLVEKAELLAEKSYKTPKDWKEKSEELNALMEEWKTIGPVPKSLNESIWRSFRKAFNHFYDQKGEYFDERKKAQKANLILKEDLCKQAELIAASRSDWNAATKEIINLQQEWKKLGGVPDKISNAIWKRFREANDQFFAKKNDAFKDKIEEEKQNLEKKEEIIAKVEQLLAQEQSKDVFEQLKALQREWSATGNVPFKKKDSINKRYNTLTDQLYEKYKKDRSELKSAQAQEHYASLKELPNGFGKLKDEERKLNKKIGFLKSEIDTWNNNMEFFSGSKNADKIKQEFQEKIDKTQQQIQRLVSELRVLRGIMKDQN